MGVKAYSVVIVRLTTAGKDMQLAHDEEVVESGGAQTRRFETIDLLSSSDDESDMAGMHDPVSQRQRADHRGDLEEFKKSPQYGRFFEFSNFLKKNKIENQNKQEP